MAEGHLNWVLKNQKAPLVQALAAQRLGIVLLQQKKYDAAIAALNTKVEADFEPLLLEAKGDVYAAQNKTKEAAQSYQQALEKLPKDAIERELKFLLENAEAKIQFYGSEVIGVQLPSTVVLQVTETQPSIKGATVSGSGKPATMETGLVVNVPDFIEAGEYLVVNTAEGTYSGRANK